jgi:hypothetical protein
MFFHWLRSENLGYEITSHPRSSVELSTRIPVNGYADDMALIGKSQEEATQILQMLERFLSFYGMELNAEKCGYQYLTHDGSPPPPGMISKWGKIPTLRGKQSYKFLGYYINTQLNFQQQYQAMVDKLNGACVEFYSRQMRPVSMHEAIMYVNSDLVSKLKHRMYLFYFQNLI